MKPAQIDYCPPHCITVHYKETQPARVIYAAMHNDYSETPVDMTTIPSEEKCNNIIVRKLLKGNRGHYGCLEHPSIILTIPEPYFDAEFWAGLSGVAYCCADTMYYVSLNARSYLKVLDISNSEGLRRHYCEWLPGVYEWYISSRDTLYPAKKLAP